MSEEEEARRVLPLIAPLRTRTGMWISVDTRRASIARQALEAGADLVNDVSAGGDDPGMIPLLAAWQRPLVLMHMQGRPATMQQRPHYGDVVEDVAAWLLERAAVCLQAGMPREDLLLDPGIGFGKTLEHNLALLAGFARRLQGCGHFLLLGASRKRFIAQLEERAGRPPSPELERLGGSLATALAAAGQGYRVLRVHDVAAHAQALRVQHALREGPMTPSLLRRLLPADLDELTALEERCFPEDPWHSCMLESALLAPTGLALGLFAPRMIGYALGQLVADEGELHSIGIDPRWRRKGQGLLLLDGFLEACREAQVRTLWLEVRASNEAAIRLYLARGFHPSGRRPGYYSDGEDALIYHCHLREQPRF